MNLYKPGERPITVECLEGCDWSLFWLKEANLPKLTTATKFSGMISFAFIITSVKFQLKLLSAKFFLLMNFITTIYSMVVLSYNL